MKEKKYRCLPPKERTVSSEIEEKLKSLSMKPEDWSELKRDVTLDKYRMLADEYQAREEAELPRCESVLNTIRGWRMCRYCTEYGKCSFKGECASKQVQ